MGLSVAEVAHLAGYGEALSFPSQHPLFCNPLLPTDTTSLLNLPVYETPPPRLLPLSLLQKRDQDQPGPQRRISTLNDCSLFLQ